MNPKILTEMRDERKLSLAEVGRRAGIDRTTISRWESGERNPTREKLEIVCDALQAGSRERARLLSAFGYADEKGGRPFYEEPVIQRAYAVITDTRYPEEFRDQLRASIAGAVNMAKFVPKKAG